jgi:archaemetzincin
VVLVRGAAPEPTLVDAAVGELRRILGAPVTVGPDLAIPPDILRTAGQISSNSIVDQMIELAGPDPEPFDHWTIALTNRDLCAPRRSFVFGEAALGGAWAVVSSARLESLESATSELASDRLVKEILHELGHLRGLDHCPDPRCVMHPSTSVEEIDRKTARFCTQCHGSATPASAS